jgi:hypothetical protein
MAAALALVVPTSAPSIPPPVTAILRRTSDGYFFRGAVVLPGQATCLLDVVFRVEHVRRFAGEYEVTLVREGDGWNEVGFRTSGLFYDVEHVYRRTLVAAKRRVEFEMVGGTQKGPLPRVLASNGAYALERAKNGWLLVYWQRVKLGPGLLRGAYARQATAESRAFMERLRDHALRTCP